MTDQTTHGDELLFAPTEEIEAAEFLAPQTAFEFAEDDGFITKEILRTGEWPKTPGVRGIVNKPLKIIKEGASSAKDRIVSLQELVQSFQDKAYNYVTIPLSDDAKDHKNLTSLNTGFVKDVWIEDKPNGTSVLKAKMHFTEPDVREKVTRGTIPDVSAGVYFDVERPDGKKFGSALNHVVLTKQPFMDGLNPFGVLAADDDEVPDTIETFVPPVAVADPPEGEGSDDDEGDEPPEGDVASQPEGWDNRLSLTWQRDHLIEALSDQLGLDEAYSVIDIAHKRAIVTNKTAQTSWVVPFELSGDGVIVAPIARWETREIGRTGSEQPPEPAAAPAPAEAVAASDESPLEQAQRLRALRSRGENHSEGGEAMGRIKSDPLEGLDFTNEDRVKEVVTTALQQAQDARKISRKGEIDAEIDRVKELGFADHPGFLRVYRDILESDDEQPALLFTSHDDQGREVGGEQEKTASQVARLLIDALPTEEKDGQVRILLSAQHASSGNDDPPPPSDEERSVEDRTADAETALYGKSSSENNGKE